jgi:membrane-associated protease RseP (regulator of RpoE activity)
MHSNHEVRMTPSSKSLALAIGLAMAGLAIAQDKPTPAQQKELDVARAQLDQAAQRYAELSRKYGDAGAAIRIEKRILRKPVIGVVLATDEQAGVRIAAVTPGSAAAGAGLRSGDRITSVDGKRVEAGTADARVQQARELLAAHDAKTSMRLDYDRDGKPTSVSLTPKVDDRVMVLQGPGGAAFDGDVKVFVGDDGDVREITADRIRIDAAGARAHAFEGRAKASAARERADWLMVAPDVRTEVIRLGSDCKGEDCKFPVLAEAFRWNGLNLASVDAGLGRYFGTTKGVLVLSTGKDLDGLQAGDVIRSIGGKEIGTPREAMDALRAQPAGGKVTVAYLRDRAPGTAQVSVPESLQIKLPMAAIAPRAPGAPGAVEHRRMVFVGQDGKVQTFEDGDGKAPPAWLPKDGQQVEKRKYVMVDKDGKRSEWEGDAGETPPAWVKSLPQDAQHRQVRKIVMLDANGKSMELETDDLAPPPPPARPAQPIPPPPPGGR